MLRSLTLAATLAILPVASFAQTAEPSGAGVKQAESGKPPLRIRSITLTGNQVCPKSDDPNAEIVVCARQGEPYRIPKELRDAKPIPPQYQSWANRAAVADDVSRRASGLPDTCSPTGSGGQTGCGIVRAQQYAAEKAEAKRQAAQIP